MDTTGIKQQLIDKILAINDDGLMQKLLLAIEQHQVVPATEKMVPRKNLAKQLREEQIEALLENINNVEEGQAVYHQSSQTAL